MKKLLLFLAILGVTQTGHAKDDGYQMAGPYAVIARDGDYRHTKAGSERDMRAALDFAERGDTTQALRIINAYAATLQRIEGHDAPLCLIQCYWLVRAMILCQESTTIPPSSLRSAHRHCGSKLYTLHSTFIKKTILPVIDRFDADSPYANGNWGAIDNRLLKGLEYTARYNLGHDDVPFETWTDCTGLYGDWTEPGQMGRGRIRDIYRRRRPHVCRQPCGGHHFSAILLCRLGKIIFLCRAKVNTEVGEGCRDERLIPSSNKWPQKMARKKWPARNGPQEMICKKMARGTC